MKSILFSISILLSYSSTLCLAKKLDGSQADLVHSMSKFVPKLHSHLERKELLTSSSSSNKVTFQTGFADSNSRFHGLDSSYLDSLLKEDEQQSPSSTSSALPPDVTASTFTQPLDHFDPNNNATFQQRFWFSTRHYKSPEKRKHGQVVPVYVLDSGETDAMNRLPYLDHGILDILTEATGGIGIVLEHRYYGQSFPDRKDLGPGEDWGTDQLRWLNNKQALEDSAKFVAGVKFPGIKEDLTAPSTPYIYYGGSYPGTRSAHMRVLYPDLIYGAIASSAVVQAIENYYAYFFPIARGADPLCSMAIQSAVVAMDKIMAPEPEKGQYQTRRDPKLVEALLEMFNLKGLSNLADLANLFTYPLGSFQARNWDPAVSTTHWDRFCDTMTNESIPVPQDNPLSLSLPISAFAFADYLRSTMIDSCVEENSPDECFGSSDFGDFKTAKPSDANGKAWLFQVCTTFGYFMTGPPVGNSDGPNPTMSGPKLVSNLLDLNYTSEVCREGFTDGEFFKIPDHPNVSEVNDIGGFNIEYSRLAFIDGQYDPWREACISSEAFNYGGARPSTLDKPYFVIPDCWHHCDENGLKSKDRKSGKEPERIHKIHTEEIQFVKSWLKDWVKPELKVDRRL